MTLVNSRFYSDLVLFSFFFSLLFCVLCAVVDGLISFWVFLELAGLSIIPCFFYNSGSSIYGFYSSLLTYVIMSGLSSVFLVSGLLFSSLYIFIFLGFVIKFGLFPFSFWVYRVFSESNWFFIFCLSVILKFPILFFCFLFQNFSLYVVYGDCIITMMTCALFFWFFSQDWEYIWCHMSLSSVSTLLVACFCSGAGVCFFIYFYYFVWASMCILFFYYVGDGESFVWKFWIFCFVLLVTPFSFPLFYKLSVCLSIFYSSFYVLFFWSLYSFSEQFFLYKLCSDYFYSSVFNGWA
uniref:NADH dehydrogenase subunit 2 n=1 Tax=Drepanidotaenia lanceolata TaxID=1732538 RepID=A0A0N9PWB4_9CEST|nr:NADH dehydrogenase subunit 2 [Drepanidotaenia lanceolata]ALH16574.1 NADH dehydrogenase subunit 2 [Drepanidotaenia lanceolata]